MGKSSHSGIGGNMKKSLFLMFVCSSLMLTTACGDSQGSVLGLPNEQADDSTERSDTPKNGIYEIASDLQVQMTMDEGLSSLRTMTLTAGTQVSVLGTATDSQGQQWVRLGLEYSSDSSTEPQDVWVLASEFNQGEFNVIDDSDPYDENGFELPGMNDAIRKKMTYCYRYVKLYLLDHGMVKEYLPGASAYMAASILPKYGFKKVSRKPSQAIVNDVCVYGGGNGGNGHIEILTSKGWYYGYGYKKSPIANHPLKGCFHK